MEKGVLELPQLGYEYNFLEPYISSEQLKIHHLKHHQAYVNGTKQALEKLEIARKNSEDVSIKALLKELSFNLSGHILHSIFWKSITSVNKSPPAPKGILAEAIEDEFGSFDRFKKEFSQAALSCEGSGWAVLSFSKSLSKLIIMQIEKHSINAIPQNDILLALDVWEHAYYLDYKNDRARYIENFWKIANWDEASRKFKDLQAK